MFTLTYDQWMAALCIWREARGCSITAKTGVFWVIINRTTDPRKRWPIDLAGVVDQPYQFSSFNLGAPASVAWPRQKNVADWGAWADCQLVVTNPLGGDPTQGANFYHDASIAPPAEAWLGKGHTIEELLKYKTVEIGSFSFYAIP